MTTSDSAAEVSRRSFLSGLFGMVASSTATLRTLPSPTHFTSPDGSAETRGTWVVLGPLASLGPGVPTGFPFSRMISDGQVESVQTGVAYAFTLDGQSVDVFANICTHLGCRVSWVPGKQHFVCPCHDGEFAPDGAVAAGPPPAPLERLRSKIEDGLIHIFVET